MSDKQARGKMIEIRQGDSIYTKAIWSGRDYSVTGRDDNPEPPVERHGDDPRSST
jgi:hypothetical protein